MEKAREHCQLFKKKPRDCFWVTFIQLPVASLILGSRFEKGHTVAPELSPPIAGLILLQAGKHWLELGYCKICELSVMIRVFHPVSPTPLLYKARTACNYILIIMLIYLMNYFSSFVLIFIIQKKCFRPLDNIFKIH